MVARKEAAGLVSGILRIVKKDALWYLGNLALLSQVPQTKILPPLVLIGIGGKLLAAGQTSKVPEIRDSFGVY